MNIDVPSKFTRTDNGTGEQTRNAIIRALSSRPGTTVRELCVMVGKASTSTIYFHLTRLEAEGKIVRDDCPVCQGKIWRVA